MDSGEADSDPTLSADGDASAEAAKPLGGTDEQVKSVSKPAVGVLELSEVLDFAEANTIGKQSL